MPKHLQINENDREVAEQFLKASIERFQRERLLSQIDEALDKQDRSTFIHLTKQLNSLKK
jgi:uncharacterized protein YpiB (UPF0302 family)